MNNMSVDILVNLAASLIWFLGGILAATAYRHIYIRAPLRRVWNLSKAKEPLYIAVSALDAQEGGPTTGLGEIEAVAFVQTSLSLAYSAPSQVRVTFSNSFPSTGLTHNIISIGGAKHNEITRTFADRLDPAILIGKDEADIYRVVDRITGKTYRYNDENSEAIIDYGVLTRMPNPYNIQRTVFTLRGIQTYGVAGAGKMLTPPYISLLTNEAKKTNAVYWQALVLTRAHGLEVFPELIAFRPLTQPLLIDSQ